jgi:MoxR-like ATPase
MSTIQIFSHEPPDAPDPKRLAPADRAPPWRRYADKPADELQPREARPMDDNQIERAKAYQGKKAEADLVNAALFLRRPLLVTGRAGVGKSTLAYAVAWQLGLGNVLRWGITSRSTLKDGLYHYDAIARLQETSRQREDGQRPTTADPSDHSPHTIGDYITLGPLGTALLPTLARGYFPRILLVDELDKSDADLPSDLLHVLEEGSYVIPEIARVPDSQKGESVEISSSDPKMIKARIPADGRVRCDDFPFIVMTSNGERDFSPAFLRRCLRLEIKRERDDLKRIVEAHLGKAAVEDSDVQSLIDDFASRTDDQKNELATDQLLNVIFILQSCSKPLEPALKETILRSLNESPTGGTI